jgi:WD40 repeat protein
LLLTGNDDGTARLWNVTTGKELRQLIGHTRYISSAVFSSDGKFVLTGSGDKTARTWDVVTGHEIKLIEGHNSSINSVAYSPKGDTILTGSGDMRSTAGLSEKTVRLWDATTGKEIMRFAGYTRLINTASFSPNSKLIITGGANRAALLWGGEKSGQIQKFEGHIASILSANFSPDGRYVVTGDWGGVARVWDIETGAELARFEGHSRVLFVAFTSDSSRILTRGLDGNAAGQSTRLWDIKTGKEIERFEGQAIAVSSDGNYVLTESVGRNESQVTVWDVANDKAQRLVIEAQSSIGGAAFSPDRRYLAITANRVIEIWDVEAGKKSYELLRTGDQLKFSADGRYLVVGSVLGRVCVFDLASRKIMKEFFGHSTWVSSVAFSPNGRYILTGSRDSTTRLWEVSTGKEICRLVTFNDGSWAVADSEGRYDASDGGNVEGLHWVVGNEPIALSQLQVAALIGKPFRI